MISCWLVDPVKAGDRSESKLLHAPSPASRAKALTLAVNAAGFGERQIEGTMRIAHSKRRISVPGLEKE
jgi:hypothetical protein